MSWVKPVGLNLVEPWTSSNKSNTIAVKRTGNTEMPGHLITRKMIRNS